MPFHRIISSLLKVFKKACIGVTGCVTECNSQVMVAYNCYILLLGQVIGTVFSTDDDDVYL